MDKGVTNYWEIVFSWKFTCFKVRISIIEEKDNIVTVSSTPEEQSIYKGKLYAGLEKEYVIDTSININFAKAIIASDDESMKKAEKKLMIRLVLAVALFLIPTLVSVMLNIFGYTADGQLCLLK